MSSILSVFVADSRPALVRSRLSLWTRFAVLSGLVLALAACEVESGSTTPPKADSSGGGDSSGSDISADSLGSDNDVSTADSLVQDADAAQTDASSPDAQTDVVANTAPKVSVTAPAVGAVFSVGQQVQVALQIDDAEDASFDLTVTPVGTTTPLYTQKGVGKTPSWTLTPSVPGALALEIAVRDPAGGEGKTTYTLLVNTAPGAPVIALEPQLPTVKDAITAKIVVPATDPDPGAGTLTYSYEWRVNGLPVEVTSATLPAGVATKGQLVEVKVSAKDGLDTGVPGAAQTVIANSAPLAPSFGVVPAAPSIATTGTLSCTVLSPATDLDLADSVTCTTLWLVDGAVDASATTAEVALTSLHDADGKQVRSGSQILCQLRCTDGEAVTLASSATAVVEEGNICASSWNTCDANATCTGNGSFAPDCACKAGYTGDGKACADIDECTTLLFTCDANATCDNTPGSYSCTCKPGYSGNGSSCSDVDECTSGDFPCASEGGVCSNTDGSYTCSCAAGFVGDGLACSDINECAAPMMGVALAMTATAEVAWTFDNSDDAVGWKWAQWQDESGTIDVLRYGNPETNTYNNGEQNGGVALSAPVTLTAAMVAQPLALRVRLLADTERGPSYDRLYLVALLDGQPWLLLHKGALSLEDQGAKLPPPKPGTPGYPYQLAVDATRLTADGALHDYLIQLPAMASETTLQLRWEFDTWDSEANSGLGVLVAGMQLTSFAGGCGNHASCVNLPGSATCACDDTAVGDGKVCTDLNDCAVNNGGCGDPMAWECIDLPYTSATCTDNNECEPDTEAGEVSPCDPYANCENTYGSFVCTCPEGFEGDGLTCVDINECETLELPGCVTNAVCDNLPGSYTCSCAEGWVGNGFEVCENRNECAEPSEEPLDDLLPLPEGATWTVTSSSDDVRWRVGDDGVLTYSDAAYADFETDGTANSGTISRTFSALGGSYIEGEAVLRVGGVFDTENGTSYDKLTITVQSGKSEFVFEKGTDFAASSAYQRLHFPIEVVGDQLTVTIAFDTSDDIDNDGKGIRIDEFELAATYNGPCSWRTSCEDTVGGYLCGACPPGFEGDGTSCPDIDECAKGLVVCTEPNSRCYNVPGDAFCDCEEGYEQTEGGCEDINECEDGNNGGCGEYGFATCENQIGAPPICTDILECAIDNGGCGDPAYVVCEEQYAAWPKCVDVDECANKNGGCGDLVSFTCTNNYGEDPSCSPRNECEASLSLLDSGIEYSNDQDSPSWYQLPSGGWAYGHPGGGYASNGPNSGRLYLFAQSVPQQVQGGAVYLLMEMDLDISPDDGDGLLAFSYNGFELPTMLSLQQIEIAGKPYVAADVTAYAGKNLTLELNFTTGTDAANRTGQGITLHSARYTAVISDSVLGWCGTRGICEDTSEGFSCSCQQGFGWNGERCIPLAVE